MYIYLLIRVFGLVGPIHLFGLCWDMGKIIAICLEISVPCWAFVRDQFKIEWSEQNVAYQLQSMDPSNPRSNRWNNILNHLGEIKPDVKDAREQLKETVKDSLQFLNVFMVELSQENQYRYLLIFP